MSVTTGKVRLSFCHIWQPMEPQNGQGEAKYSVTILIPKSDQQTLNAIYNEMETVKQQGIVSKWGGVLPPIVKNPLYDGDGMRPSGEPFGEECKGCMVITASSKSQPAVVDLNVQPIINQSEVYSGCYARVSLSFFAYAQNGNKGLGCGLNCIQKIEDGEPLAGGVSAQEAFGGANAYPLSGQTAAPMQPQFPANGMPTGQPYPQQPPLMPGQQNMGQAQYAPPQSLQTAVDPITGLPQVNGIMGV